MCMIESLYPLFWHRYGCRGIYMALTEEGGTGRMWPVFFVRKLKAPFRNCLFGCYSRVIFIFYDSQVIKNQ